MPCHSNGMPVPGQPIQGVRWRASSLAVHTRSRGNFDRRQPQPFRTRRAVDIPVKPGMIRQDLKTAADQQDMKKKFTQWVTRSQAGKPWGSAAVPSEKPSGTGKDGSPTTAHCTYAAPIANAKGKTIMTSVLRSIRMALRALLSDASGCRTRNALAHPDFAETNVLQSILK